MHVSVIDVGNELQAIATGTQFACPLCPKVKPASLKKIKQHFEGHINTALHFEDKIICRCNMPCRGLAHYHCPNCWKTILKKKLMESHVKFCKSTIIFTQVTLPPPPSPASVSAPERTPPPPCDHDYSLLVSTSSDFTKVVQNYDSVSPSSPSPASTPERTGDHEDVLLALSSSDSNKEDRVEGSELFVSAKLPGKNLKMVKCPHCALVLYKKNLTTHIRRKHACEKHVTASFHLLCCLCKKSLTNFVKKI